ncbi:ATP-binding protein [Geotalea uraniireducens]|uniref:ATP-binding protein n=1 Tax=Geotalea uraniireducens (strain Rf4) TaxID=351605 RepID=A5G4D8_GEOUR|nr:ATP-binding protein [Geotalea uraniireducens]ABQ26656.1 hypothetical protein Gura_2478 [Geotalea uraniireducens Rf4]
METIPISMNAVRVCDAIARIGYEPHSALMDIIDNSVAADALNVKLYVDLVEGKTINQRNNVARYRVVDDGKGMDEDGIKNAFKLGSDANYKQNSLSKYGMGLKSAGFSLGLRIQIISKTEGQLTRKYFLDRKVIEARNEYVVCCEDLTAIEKEEITSLLPNSSGTIVEISGCGSIYHTSAKTTIEKLKHRLGVTYYSFLSASEGSRLNIKLIYPGEEGLDIKPFDILFTHDSDPGFDPTSYDAKKPCFAFKGEWNIPALGEEGAPPIKLEVVTFPQDTMGASSSPLGEDDRARIRTYRVSRENKGFFIYRNGRLIRWGDDLDNLVPKDLIGFRARMELLTEHDDLLHVDVSKQRLEMDDETRNNLDLLMRLPRKQAAQVFAVCKDLLRKGNGEGAGFTNTVDSVPEEDPIEDLTPPDPAERKERAKKREEESKETLDKIKPEEPEEETSTTEESDFVKIRYSDNLPGINLWSTQKDAVQGTYVIINRRHAFYQSVLGNLDESSPERLALEAVIFCCAIGENKTYENLTLVPEDSIRKVFERYYSVLSFNISAWATGNQHIFGNIKI